MKNTIRKIMILSLALTVILLACESDTSRIVRFYASSTSGLVSGNYMSSAGLNIFIDRPSPLSVKVETERCDYVILTASSSLSTGTMTARIYVDGELF